jgi:hypothetical protein
VAVADLAWADVISCQRTGRWAHAAVAFARFGASVAFNPVMMRKVRRRLLDNLS